PSVECGGAAGMTAAHVATTPATSCHAVSWSGQGRDGRGRTVPDADDRPEGDRPLHRGTVRAALAGAGGVPTTRRSSDPDTVRGSPTPDARRLAGEHRGSRTDQYASSHSVSVRVAE